MMTLGGRTATAKETNWIMAAICAVILLAFTVGCDSKHTTFHVTSVENNGVSGVSGTLGVRSYSLTVSPNNETCVSFVSNPISNQDVSRDFPASVDGDTLLVSVTIPSGPCAAKVMPVRYSIESVKEVR